MNAVNIRFLLVFILRPHTEWLPLCYHWTCLSPQKPDSTASGSPEDSSRFWRNEKSAVKQSALERKNLASIAELCMIDKTQTSTAIPQTDRVSSVGWLDLTCTRKLCHRWNCTGRDSLRFTWKLGHGLLQKCLHTCSSPVWGQNISQHITLNIDLDFYL